MHLYGQISFGCENIDGQQMNAHINPRDMD